MNERTWKEYCARVARYRLEFSMQVGQGPKDSGRIQGSGLAVQHACRCTLLHSSQWHGKVTQCSCTMWCFVVPADMSLHRQW